jgi:lysine-N-methylase
VAEALTARYLRRFSCLGGTCEDTCCQSWQIPIDPGQYRILEAAMAGTAGEREELAAAVQRDPRTGLRHLRLADDGTCRFLTPARLCSVQARYGEPALPQVCATYPRDIGRSGDRLEVWGSLSCPEMARQCLLFEDALELVDAPAEASSRWVPTRIMPAEVTPYQRHLDDVRGAVHRLLSLRGPALRTRLFLLAYLGKESSAFFHRDAPAVDPAQLGAVLAHVEAPATIAHWERELHAMPPPRALTANLVSQLMNAQASLQPTSFQQLVAGALASYGEIGSVAGKADGSAHVLWAAYAQRREAWQAAHGARLDRYFENYAKNFWMREWYTSSVDLLAHARRLLMRVAVLRLLLFSHPALQASQGLAAAAQGEILDRAAVDTFYKMARAVEHQDNFLDRIAATVVREGLQTFAHSTFLILV